MSRFATNADRAEQRQWLRRAVRSSILDRVPHRYDPDGLGHGPRTLAVAQDLLARMMDPERGPSPRVLADVRAFRAWVEARQQDGRRIILAEGHGSGTRPGPRDERPAPRAEMRFEMIEALERPRPAPLWPEADPMWDRWLDG